MPIIERVTQVKNVLKKLLLKATKNGKASVTVGFTQSYSLFVHELHPTKSKFLENAARNKATEIATVVRTSMQRGLSLEKSLILAGLRLQREAQVNTPVDTGALKASAFTSVTRDEVKASQTAFAISEKIRLSKKR